MVAADLRGCCRAATLGRARHRLFDSVRRTTHIGRPHNPFQMHPRPAAQARRGPSRVVMSNEQLSTNRGEFLFASFVRAPETPGAPEAPAPAPSPELIPEPKSAPYLWCSDCRTPMRTYYFALNERPVCGKCKRGYDEKIERGVGPRAFQRALAYGLGAGLASAAVFAFVVLTMGFARMFLLVGVGVLVAKAINRATGGFYARRYQLLAVAVTYFSIGLGCLAPVIKLAAEMDDAPAPAAASADSSAASADDELDALLADPSAAAAQGVAERRAAELSPEARAAERMASGGFLGAAGVVVVLLLAMPLLSMLAYGVYGAGIGVLALGYGMYKAWDITSHGLVSYEMNGPYRVGTGPIPVTR